jgi:alpha/beta superfamily hydrolase
MQIARADPRVTALVAIAPPVAIYDFGFLHGETRPILLVAGDRDPFCPAAGLDSLAARLGSRTERIVLHGAEHLLTTHLEALQDAVRVFAARILDRL